MKRYIRSTTEDNSYANHLIKISGKDAKYALANLNKSHKTLGLYGEPGDAGYYVSEFEEATPGYMWASNKGLQILDDAGISYELIDKAVESCEEVKASGNPFYDKLSDYDKRIADAKLRKDYPYQIVSMAAILRDYIKPEYVGKFHEKLVDIADSIYNVGSSIIDDFLPEYKEIYDRFGKDYFDLVLKDMRALDGQITSDAKVEELLADYEDRINSSALNAINMSTKVTAATNSTGVITGPYDTSLHYDLWYGDEFVPRKYGADAFVSGNGEYRGNILDDTGAAIGDYYTDNSVLIEKNFLIDFGE